MYRDGNFQSLRWNMLEASHKAHWEKLSSVYGLEEPEKLLKSEAQKKDMPVLDQLAELCICSCQNYLFSLTPVKDVSNVFNDVLTAPDDLPRRIRRDMPHHFELALRDHLIVTFAYVFFNYALLNGMPSSSESLLDSTPEALESFQKMKKELCHLQRLHPEDSALKAAETDLYYSIGCFCIYRGLYEQGVSAIRKLLQNPALSEEARDLAHEQMIFYGIQTYQTNVMRENIDAALSLTKGKNAARYAINRRYNGYLLVMEGRYEDAREELLRTLVLLHDSAEDEVERRLQSAYAHDYIGEAYRKQGMYARAIEEYQIAIDMIGEYPTSTSTPIFYVDWAMASLAIGDYAAAHNALSNSNRAADNVKEPTGYFRTLYCACNALMCFADGDYRHCASEILQCEQLTKALIVPYDTGILYLTKALLCCYSAQLDIAETPLADVLTEDIAYYCAHCRKCMAGGKAGAFEQELLKRLECGCSDPLPGFLQVTKN